MPAGGMTDFPFDKTVERLNVKQTTGCMRSVRPFVSTVIRNSVIRLPPRLKGRGQTWRMKNVCLIRPWQVGGAANTSVCIFRRTFSGRV